MPKWWATSCTTVVTYQLDQFGFAAGQPADGAAENRYAVRHGPAVGGTTGEVDAAVQPEERASLAVQLGGRGPVLDEDGNVVH